MVGLPPALPDPAALHRARELVHAIDHTAIEHEIAAEHQHREAARARRERPMRGLENPPQCHGCRRFVGRTAYDCAHCGMPRTGYRQ